MVEAPPPPKCEKLDEGCIAQGGTKARLDHSDWRIEPPANWTYAQGTMVIASHDGSVLAATVEPAGPAKLNRAKRDELFANLVSELKITLPKKKFVWPKKADQTLDAGPLKVSLYQLDVTREGKKGPLLFFSVTPAEGEGMLGAGFVPDDDSTNADQAILAAIRSIDQLVVAPQGAEPAVTAPALFPGQVVGGNYAVQSALSQPGLSVTYQALTAPSREVAIKLFDPALRTQQDALALLERCRLG